MPSWTSKYRCLVNYLLCQPQLYLPPLLGFLKWFECLGRFGKPHPIDGDLWDLSKVQEIKVTTFLYLLTWILKKWLQSLFLLVSLAGFNLPIWTWLLCIKTDCIECSEGEEFSKNVNIIQSFMKVIPTSALLDPDHTDLILTIIIRWGQTNLLIN